MATSRPPRSTRPPPGTSPSGAERVANRYVVKEELASGGMGIVYRVLDRSTGEDRALKRLNREAVSQPFLVAAFEREYQVLAGLAHPRIIRVFDYGVDEIGAYYTMELLEGQDMRKAAPLPYREACALLRDVATSLALLHARRLIHRDLSPANVRMTPDGHCKLIDFGALASFGSSRLVVGTPPAIPPEALKGAPLDQRADLYGLGALAYWILTEHHAYPARQIEDLAEMWRVDAAPPSSIVGDIPKELDGLVLSLLSGDPLARPASAAEVVARLNSIAELMPEEGEEAERLAQSFLLNPRFVGRAALLEDLKERTESALQGRGSAVRIEASAGMGRTRLLEEIGIRAQIAGAAVLRVDASTSRDVNGAARVLAVRMLDAIPRAARECARHCRLAIAALGRDVDTRLSENTSIPLPAPSPASLPPPPDSESDAAGSGTLEGWFAEVSQTKPLAIEVDNVDDADDASLGLLAALAKLAASHPILLVVSERERREPRMAPGLVTLRSDCTRVTCSPLSPAETLELLRSFFGSAPHVERLAEWLHGRTAGSPLHCVEILRHLVDPDGYRFSSTALREAVLGGMDDHRLAYNHRRLGEAFASLAGPTEHELRIEAGWHLIKGGDPSQGADMIAEVTHDSATVRMLTANLHRVGEPIEAALEVYKRQRRSAYARVPLLTALAYTGYYEDRRWGDRYGDDALDACDDLCGLRAARDLRRFFGRWLGLVMGLALAFVRFKLSPAHDRKYPFRELIVQLFGAATTLTGMAASSLDAERARSVADILEVFSVLPQRLTPVGIYQFCRGLQEIGRERQTVASAAFETLLERLTDPRFYPTLTKDKRPLYVTGAHYARGSFAIMLANGRAALESADALDAAGLKLYAMIASQLRFLYYMNRGEFSKAATHHEQVELHAAHVGSAWQVETWEGASLIPLYTNLSDVEALTRVSVRIEELSRTVPSLKLYARVARLSLMLVVGDGEQAGPLLEAELEGQPPRSFIGWAAFHGLLARAYNERGLHVKAKTTCERALAHITDADREYVSLFLPVDIQMAIAEAALGQGHAGLARIDALLERFRQSDNPLVQGLLHEARAQIAWMGGCVEEYGLSLALVEHWLRRTGTPALIAKCERLAELRTGPASATSGQGAGPSSSAITDVDSGRLEPEARTVKASVRRSREIV